MTSDRKRSCSGEEAEEETHSEDPGVLSGSRGLNGPQEEGTTWTCSVVYILFMWVYLVHLCECDVCVFILSGTSLLGITIQCSPVIIIMLCGLGYVENC